MSLPCCYRSETNPDGCGFRRHKTSPLCLHHLFEVIRDAFYDDMLPPDVLAELRVELAGAMMARYRDAQAEERYMLENPEPRPGEHDPVVYYVALTRGRVKIGTTKNLSRRLAEMRSGLDDLLAVEPGGHDVETLRHRQFRPILMPGAREEFERTPALDRWMAAMRERHAGLADVANR